MQHKHDRTKSTGFLDTLFTRSTKRSHRNATYSGAPHHARPVSAENDFADSQDVELEVLKLTTEEVNQKFMEILEDMNINVDKREPLMKKSISEKRDMLKMHMKGRNLNDHETKHLACCRCSNL